MNLTQRVILITGGTSGIGLALAQSLVARRNQVIITGRDAARLEAAASGAPGLHTFVADVTQERAMRDLFTHIQAEFGGLDILVNNAGVLYDEISLMQGRDFALLDEEVAINLLAPIKYTALALPLLRQRPDAAVVNISSALAIVPATSLPVYSATKAAVRSFTQALRRQLAQTSIRVFEVAPPNVATPLSSGLKGARLAPEVVVRRIIAGLEHDTYELLIGQTRPLAFAARLSPGLGMRLLSGALEETLPAPSA